MDLDDRNAFLFGLTYIVCRRYRMMLAVFFAVFFLFVFAGYLVTPTWKAEVLLLASQSSKPVVSPFGGGVPAPSGGEPARDLAIMLGGKGIAYDMVRQFNLDERLRRKSWGPGYSSPTHPCCCWAYCVSWKGSRWIESPRLWTAPIVRLCRMAAQPGGWRCWRDTDGRCNQSSPCYYFG